MEIVQVDLLVDQYPGFIIPINMFAIDIRTLGGVIRRQNSTNVEVEEPWEFERVIYNLQEDLIMFISKNPSLSPGDEVTLEIDYDCKDNKDDIAQGHPRKNFLNFSQWPPLMLASLLPWKRWWRPSHSHEIRRPQAHHKWLESVKIWHLSCEYTPIR